MKRRLLLPLLLVAAALVLVAQTQAMSAPKLRGTVGPGFTISLKDGTGKKVTRLKAGKYTFVVTDKSGIHNFILEKSRGGKFEKAITGVAARGKKTVTVTLSKGRWEVYCGPHPSMQQQFTVT
jgi:plastocyanin